MQKKFPLRFLLSLGPLGHIPKASGTWASLAALLPLTWVNLQLPHLAWYLLFASFTITLLGIGLWHRYQLYFPDQEDPPWLVLDELVGQWLSVALTILLLPMLGSEIEMNTTLNLWFWGGQWGLFRFFDIIKPWPVSWADQKKGALWVFLDDLLAGVYSAFTYLLLIWVLALLRS